MSIVYTEHWVTPDAFNRLMEIDWACFEHSWTAAEWFNADRNPKVIIKLVRSHDEIVGYVLFELLRTRIDVIRLAVHPSHRHAGVGQMIMDRMFDRLAKGSRQQIFFRVRESNTPAHLFLRSCGFSAQLVDRNFYLDTGEDAYLFVYLRVPEPAMKGVSCDAID